MLLALLNPGIEANREFLNSLQRRHTIICTGLFFVLPVNSENQVIRSHRDARRVCDPLPSDPSLSAHEASAM